MPLKHYIDMSMHGVLSLKDCFPSNGHGLYVVKNHTIFSLFSHSNFTPYFSFLLLKFCKTYELEQKIRSSRLPWPGDEGNERWNHAWQAIKKVWLLVLHKFFLLREKLLLYFFHFRCMALLFSIFTIICIKLFISVHFGLCFNFFTVSVVSVGLLSAGFLISGKGSAQGLWHIVYNLTRLHALNACDKKIWVCITDKTMQEFVILLFCRSGLQSGMNGLFSVAKEPSWIMKIYAWLYWFKKWFVLIMLLWFIQKIPYQGILLRYMLR